MRSDHSGEHAVCRRSRQLDGSRARQSSLRAMSSSDIARAPGAGEDHSIGRSLVTTRSPLHHAGGAWFLAGLPGLSWSREAGM